MYEALDLTRITLKGNATQQMVRNTALSPHGAVSSQDLWSLAPDSLGHTVCRVLDTCHGGSGLPQSIVS